MIDPDRPRQLLWEARLAELIERERARPFDLLQNNCCHWAVAIIAAVLGVDAWDYVGAPRVLTLRGVAAWLKDSGGVRGTATRALGEPVAPLQLRTGDLALVRGVTRPELGEATESHSTGAVVGNRVWCLGPDGLFVLPLTSVVCGWRLGA